MGGGGMLGMESGGGRIVGLEGGGWGACWTWRVVGEGYLVLLASDGLRETVEEFHVNSKSATLGNFVLLG